jgi:hypothetical protein
MNDDNDYITLRTTPIDRKPGESDADYDDRRYLILANFGEYDSNPDPLTRAACLAEARRLMGA